MKKYAKSLLSLILALMLVFALVGCGEDDVADDDDEDEDEEEVQEKESKEEDEDDEEVTEIEVAEEEEVELEEGWVLFESVNGYTVAYPEKYEVTSVSDDMDFQIVSEEGAGFTIGTSVNEYGETVDDYDRETYEEMLSMVYGEDIVLELYEEQDLGDGDAAITIGYKISGMALVQSQIFHADVIYTISLGGAEDVDESVINEFMEILETFTIVE